MNKGLINPKAEFLSISEIGKLFTPPISRVTLWKWQQEGKLNLTPYYLGSKKFYKRSEVMAEIEGHKNADDFQNNSTNSQSLNDNYYEDR